MLPNISLEQTNVIEELLHYNVCVDSVAGSGKTTCSLYIAKKFNKLKILLLTYNAKSIVIIHFVLKIMIKNVLQIQILI